MGNGPTDGTDPSGQLVFAEDAAAAKEWQDIFLTDYKVNCTPVPLSSGRQWLYFSSDAFNKLQVDYKATKPKSWDNVILGSATGHADLELKSGAAIVYTKKWQK